MSQTIAIGGISVAGATCAPVIISGPFNISISGSFVGSAVLEVSRDGGSTWGAVALPGPAPLVMGAPGSWLFDAANQSAMYRVRSLTHVSGELVWRISQ